MYCKKNKLILTEFYVYVLQVFNDNLHKIVINEDGINSLIIFTTHKYDDGTYTCVAQNRAGEDRFTVGLNVKRKT